MKAEEVAAWLEVNAQSLAEQGRQRLSEQPTEQAAAIRALIAERDALREVLRKIAAPTYGTEWTQTDEEQAEILGRHLFSIQKIARAALDRKP